MSRALIVVESMFGNTRSIAGAIAEGIAEYADVQIADAATARTDLPDTIDLLVVGGPTHAFGMTRVGTRQAAVERGGDAAAGHAGGIREWIGHLRADTARTRVAAFDTRVKKRGVPGSAARSAARTMRRRGLQAVTDPHSFFVKDLRGPLAPGERDRAKAWGRELGATLTR